MKRKMVLATVLMLSFGQVIPAYAAEVPSAVSQGNEIMPLYEYADTVVTTIKKGTGGKVTCGVRVDLDQTGTIDITMKLQRLVSGTWKTLATWNDEKTGLSFNYVESKVLSDTSNLRVVSTSTITVAGDSETITQIEEL